MKVIDSDGTGRCGEEMKVGGSESIGYAIGELEMRFEENGVGRN